MSRLAPMALAALAALTGCGGGGSGPSDAGGHGDADATSGCAAACDDGRFCNGVELCDPGNPGADERGCIAGALPCAGECDEDVGACTSCPDADGDGHQDAVCGGDDCDDTDAARFPGNAEVCDADGLDEDCDPRTLGDDADGDGYVSSECCNLQPDGTKECGFDCDDTSMDVNPEVLDLCGNGDEDCDGEVDEDPNRTYYRDRDGDGFGTPDDTIAACEPTGSYVLLDTDCDDDLPTINPDEDEQCDSMGADEDCDGASNEGCTCAPLGDTQACGETDVGACSLGVQQCLADGDDRSIWGECTGDESPSDELCNGVDDDCDGSTDEGFECEPGTTETGTNACGRTGERSCLAASCTWDAADFSRMETNGTCDYCDDTGHGLAQEIGYATATISRTFGEGMVELLGDATEGSGNITLALYSDPAPRVGAAYQPDAIELGYGGARLEVIEMRSVRPAGATQPPGDGWAIVMASAEGGGSLLGAGDDNLGVPRERDGLSIEWRRYQEDAPADPTDSLVVRQLRASGDDPVIARADPRPEAYTDSSAPRQRVEAQLAPDYPGTTQNETTVLVRFHYMGSWTEVYSCGPSSTECPFAIAAGTPMRFGLSAAVGAGHQETFYYDSTGGDDELIPTLEVTGLCP